MQVRQQFRPSLRWNSISSVGQRIDRYVERKLLTVVGAHAFAVIALVGHAERAAKSIFAQHHHEIILMEQTFQMNIPILVQAADTGNDIERPVNGMIEGRLFSRFRSEKSG